jgi:hypothetical protein
MDRTADELNQVVRLASAYIVQRRARREVIRERRRTWGLIIFGIFSLITAIIFRLP